MAVRRFLKSGWMVVLASVLVSGLIAGPAVVPAGASEEEKKPLPPPPPIPPTLPRLPPRWWDAPSCFEKFVQTSTPVASTVRLNNRDQFNSYRVRWLKIQRRLGGIRVGTPYVVPCRLDCDLGPGGQTEIPVLPGDFPDGSPYEEAERIDVGCEMLPRKPQ